ncbi:hypothetical protein GQ53DRAFT_216336 [Thozetella sp. PMI_491]|nr:hypothetical protein GQ53DRAFT_216336 [Thozetella sp. PMI_491]
MLSSAAASDISRNHSQSLFFTLPLELRNAIYILVLGIQRTELHLSRRDGKFQLSVCAGSDDDPESTRELEGADSGYSACAGRAMSQWGPHWKCEAYMLDSLEQGSLRPCSSLRYPFWPIFQTCEQIFYECRSCISRSTTLHISDLETANIFLRSSLNVLYPVHTLRFTFFLPPEFYQAAQNAMGIEGTDTLLEAGNEKE